MKKVTFLGVFIWVLASSFFLYEFFLQVFLSTVSHEVMHELNLDASSYSLMTAAYFLPYAVMQIPVGILMDKYGARKLLTLAIAVASTGVFWFTFAHSFSVGFSARLLMGFGSSFAYVGLLILSLNWFPKRHFGLMIGLANLLGSLGPFLAGGPLAYLLTLFDNNWRLILLWIACVGAMLALFVGIFVRSSPKRDRKKVIFLDPYKEPLSSKIKKLAFNSQAWFVVLFTAFAYISLPLLGAYWGSPYLQARGFTSTQAASISSMLWVGYASGAPLIGKISDSLKRRKPPMLISACIGVVASFFIVYPETSNLIVSGILFYFIGFASAGCVISYAAISEHVTKNVQGTSIGFNNAMATFFAALIPPIVSFLIEMKTPENIHHYSVSDFQRGLVVMPIFYAIAFFISWLFIKETYCRSQHEVVTARKSGLTGKDML